MRPMFWLLLIAAALPAQEDGGRDGGEQAHAIHFVRWRRSPESGEIYRSAWQSLEPHLVGVIGRQRLVDFEGDAARARAYFEAHADAALIVAFGAEAAAGARKALPQTPVVEVSEGPAAEVSTTVDRAKFAALLQRFAPKAHTVALPGGGEDPLPGFTVKPCATAAEADACDLAWLRDGGEPFAVHVPLVTTSEFVPEGQAVLTVRPDPRVAGWKVAALVVENLRDGKPLTRQTIERLYVTVDLDAARAVGYRVPLDLLARADAVRRTP